MERLIRLYHRLCTACSAIKLKDLGPSSPVVPKEHHTLSQLIRSANGGCPCCQLIVKEIGDLRRLSVGRFEDEGVGCEITIEFGEHQCKMVHVIRASKATFRTEFEFFEQNGMFTRSENCASGVKLGQSLVESVDSQEAFKTIRGWLDTCLDSHAYCSQSPSILPTRVLDLSGDNPVLLENKPIRARYIALSHCWGGVPLLTTTKKTIDARKQSIPIQFFPPNFDDAITVASKLGIQYLWIDSLCIIQDSKEDWLSESGKMRQYYQNAYLVLSILDGKDSRSGIFGSRDRLRSVELWEPHLQLRPLLEAEHTVFSNAVLNTRAWALQERLLATRILHFSKREMFWECTTCSTRESNPGMLMQSGTDIILSEDGNFKRIIALLRSKPNPDTGHAMDTWYRLVAQYTRRNLTRSTDKLAAISAIASNFNSITGFTYAAGIGKEDLQSLLWFSSLAAEKPEDYQAPSWSWAATNGQVSLRFDSEKPTTSERDAKIIEIDAITSGPDLFGPVSGGSLKLQASTMEVEYRLTLPGGSRASIHGLGTPSTNYLPSGRFSISTQYPSFLGDAFLDYIETQEATGSVARSIGAILDNFRTPKPVPASRPCTAVFIQNRVSTQVANSGLINEEASKLHLVNWFLLVTETNPGSGVWKRIGVLYSFEQHLEVFTRSNWGKWVEREMVNGDYGCSNDEAHAPLRKPVDLA